MANGVILPSVSIKKVNLSNVGTSTWGSNPLPCNPLDVIAVVPYNYNQSVSANYPRSDLLNAAASGFEWYVDAANRTINCIDRANSGVVGVTLFYIG